ncbi:hypothetical protein A3B57_00025 [Microgenomates group bacterium RIFCSPLOWO2_01_FULL_47_10]|nr:MAG: hypothetical protein A3B57_00025 [Microgenomates group bacterium RIFCSPLOWO2_01_FULL_47_10]
MVLPTQNGQYPIPDILVVVSQETQTQTDYGNRCGSRKRNKSGGNVTKVIFLGFCFPKRLHFRVVFTYLLFKALIVSHFQFSFRFLLGFKNETFCPLIRWKTSGYIQSRINQHFSTDKSLSYPFSGLSKNLNSYLPKALMHTKTGGQPENPYFTTLL